MVYVFSHYYLGYQVASAYLEPVVVNFVIYYLKIVVAVVAAVAAVAE